MSDSANEESKMPMLDHLVELRRRLTWSVIAFFVLFFISFYFAAAVFDFLVQPLQDLWQGDTSRRLIFTALHEKFFTEIKIAFFVAAFVSFPIVSNQLWAFVAPGLYKNEKRAFLPFLIATPILFFIGGAFVYYLVLPVAWEFFAGYEQAGGDGKLAIQLEPKVDQYLSLVMRLIFAFGLSFELPVVLTLLAKVGIVDAAYLRKQRRYAVVVAFVAAAVLTPPDPISQLGLAIPIIILYEISIICAGFVGRAKEAKNRADDDETDDSAKG
ncbi:MAG: twin-arginine translocase subunit TatC [Alphaproteobacteria bacterium]|nr:twin-arginine translocase subunit TatC [Alphaproteobacteria bacterium]